MCVNTLHNLHSTDIRIQISNGSKRTQKNPNMSYSVIITASYIPSHPSIEFIKRVLDSLKYVNLADDTLIVLAHDYNDSSAYQTYLENLSVYVSVCELFSTHFDKPNIKLLVRENHGCLTGNIRNAMLHINSDYVLIVQHDLPFVQEFNISEVIEDMQTNTELKHVRFNKRANIKFGFDSINDLFGDQFKAKNYTYTKTPGWSDNNHIALASYYREIVLKECSDGTFMENTLQGKITDETAHKKYGTYLFGPINHPEYITHTDGRGNASLI